MSTKPLSEKWALQDVKYNNLANLIRAAHQQHLIAVSDGSHKNNIGTAAVRIESTTDSTAYIESCFQIPTRSEKMQSTRAELGGVLGLIILLHTMKDFYDLASIQVHSKCDNSTATTISNQNYIPSPTQPDWDLISAIVKTKKARNLEIKCEWI